MRLVEDLPTRRVFEERGHGARPHNPPGTVHNEAANIGVLVGVIALVAASFSHGGLQTIQQGNTSGRVVLVTLISTVVFLVCVLSPVIYMWHLYTKAVIRIVQYIFDLSNNTLFIVDTEAATTLVSSDKYPCFVVESTFASYRVILSGVNVNAIYESYGPPPAEFISALTAIGLRKVDKLKRN
jgi:hypothetical protein